MREGYEKRFNQGDIVYWCHHGGNANYSVHWGMVDEQFSNAVVVDYLVPRERRMVDGIPIEDFQSEQHFRKLPKGWSYDTRLYEITYRDLLPEEVEFKFDITNPDTLKEAYNRGFLVKDNTIFHGNIESEITKDGFRIVKKYPMFMHHIDQISILPYKLYFTYEEAKEEVDKNIAEFYRQAALSEYEWSVEQIDNELDRWQQMYSISDLQKQKYRDFLLGMKDVENIETRVLRGEIQWKYLKNKRWNYIEV